MAGKKQRRQHLLWLLSASNNMFLLVALLAITLWQCGYL